MSNLYQTTTESIESLEKWPSCAPPLPCKKRRGMEVAEEKRRNDDREQTSSDVQADKKSGRR